jgi:hypothetical protein
MHPSQRELADKTKSWPDQNKKEKFVDVCKELLVSHA